MATLKDKLTELKSQKKKLHLDYAGYFGIKIVKSSDSFYSIITEVEDDYFVYDSYDKDVKTSPPNICAIRFIITIDASI